MAVPCGAQVTYRYGGHSMSDPGTSYRTREEIKKMKESSDPIQGLKIRALENNLVTEDDFKACIPWWLQRCGQGDGDRCNDMRCLPIDCRLRMRD
jgi:hypothetical protein